MSFRRAGPVLFVSYVALINVDSDEGLPFVREFVVVAVVAAGLALVLARRRMAQLDRWEDQTPGTDPESGTSGAETA